MRSWMGVTLALAMMVHTDPAGAEGATAHEVVARVRAAARELASAPEATIARVRARDPAFVWKDSYVFVSDCATGRLLANPFQPEREGRPIAEGATYAGVAAAEREIAQCAAARLPGGGWYAYAFPRPGSDAISRKISFLLAVPGGDGLITGAGIYDETATLEQLQAISAAAD